MYRTITALLSVMLFAAVSVSAQEMETKGKREQLKKRCRPAHTENAQARKGHFTGDQEWVEIMIEGPNGQVTVKKMRQSEIPE